MVYLFCSQVTHPGNELPVVLAASMHALACLLSYDGMSNMGITKKLSKGGPNYFGDDKFLLSLLNPTQVQNTHERNSPFTFAPPSAFAKPYTSPGPFINKYINPAYVAKQSPSISTVVPVQQSMESASQGESIPQNLPTVKSKRNKKKKKKNKKEVIVGIPSGEPSNPSPTPKPSLAGYGATMYGPYGSFGVKRHRGDL